MRRAWGWALAVVIVAGVTARGQQDTSTIGVPTVLTPRSAADSVLDARTSAVASQLRCPVCQGLSIQDSPSELAQSMRSLVHDQLAAGKTPDEVKAYFVSKYGEWILLAPKPHGFNLVAYAVPMLVVLGGGCVIVLAVRRWTGGVAHDGVGGAA
ncbi:MAG TPA: cytochrome c-type biogenesis protein [Gemmatimonadaceae bacterium]|nr:cytochrome c-type biogenesis protein [Gemmatimonadaceae bacterium]